MLKKNKIKLNIIVMLVCGIILIFGSGITYSLFTSSSRLIANQKVAKFIFEAKKTDLIELPITNINPGDETEYTFQVANSLNSKQSDVTINYQITIKTYHFMPLDIEFVNSDTRSACIGVCLDLNRIVRIAEVVDQSSVDIDVRTSQHLEVLVDAELVMPGKILEKEFAWGHSHRITWSFACFHEGTGFRDRYIPWVRDRYPIDW